MPESKLRVPQFKTEAEEADWWANNQDILTERFESAVADGQLRRGWVLGQARQQSTDADPPIPLDPEDVSLARTLAAKRGLLYESYIKMLLHEALAVDKKKLAS